MPVEISCPHCGRSTRTGLSVCQGCGAEIVYGPSHDEAKAAVILGAFLGAAVIFGSNQTYGTNLGLDWYVGAMTAGAILCYLAIGKARRGAIRFFRTKTRF